MEQVTEYKELVLSARGDLPAAAAPHASHATISESIGQPQAIPTRRRKSIGRGAFGSVVVQPCGTRVIKTARKGSSPRNHKTHMRTILRECSVYIHLPTHQRLLPFYDCAATPVSASITLGYCKNGNLYDYLEAHPEATLCQRTIWCIEATEGLAHLHRHKVIHCDLRPDNFLVDDDLRLRIIDFGGSAIDDDIPLAAEAEGYFLPRPPPWACNTATDLFALGSTLYHIVTGHRPHQDRAPQDDITASFERKEYPDDVHTLLIGAVVLKCWKSEYKYAADVYYELVPLMDRFRAEAENTQGGGRA
ncbi:serine threonine protein kinase [Ophiostoma piceae UAMH 11346]|uniref:EKC/KEOPS complex subunit BUD32 n=1 Tax=Ophiostoma piceae (strain UAMH 11346) TaxID=1262450 RepID=S3CGU4_OPHP1|nr:serine threonine protein kinase [Ophiostoma piceae UAMH 11346]